MYYQAKLAKLTTSKIKCLIFKYVNNFDFI